MKCFGESNQFWEEIICFWMLCLRFGCLHAWIFDKVVDWVFRNWLIVSGNVFEMFVKNYMNLCDYFSIYFFVRCWSKLKNEFKFYTLTTILVEPKRIVVIHWVKCCHMSDNVVKSVVWTAVGRPRITVHVGPVRQQCSQPHCLIPFKKRFMEFCFSGQSHCLWLTIHIWHPSFSI